MVDIMGIVREANGRTKIAVKTNDRDVDAVGACVGMRGMRVQSIVQELRGEKIDIVEHSEDPEVFVRNALSPAKISRIIRDDGEHQMTIIVMDDQMSLAIGKKGQNVRLAAKLVGWRINIQGSSEVTDLFKQPGLLASQKEGTAKIDFLAATKSAKGFGEKIIAILFANDVVTVERVIELGISGLSELSGIGPKKAEAILTFAQSLVEEVAKSTKAGEEVADKELDEDVEEVEKEISEPVEEVGGEEESEILVGELSGIDSEIIKRLSESGFETLAELSITPAGELVQIEGIDIEIATTIIDQAKKRVGNMESV
jgi:N utilization substance protein A